MCANVQAGENLWRPASETGAAGTQAMFLAWASATGAAPGHVRDPDSLLAWARAEAGACATAVAAFAGLREAAGWEGNLLRYRGSRAALLVWHAPGAYRTYTRDELRAGAWKLPPGTWQDLTHLAASHLLAADTRPADTIQWLGAPGALWPLGAWIAGTCVVLGGPAQDGARCFVTAPAWPPQAASLTV